MKNKKLIILFWDLGIGGVQKRIRDIALDISKHQPACITYILIRRTTKDGFCDQFSALKNVHIVTYSFNNKKIRPPLGFIIWIFVMYIKLSPDVILTFLPPLSIVAIIIKKAIFWIPSHLVINDGVYVSAYLQLRNQNWIKPFIRFLYPLADKIIVPTKACKNDFVHNFGLNKQSIVVIPNWTLLGVTRPQKPLYDAIYIGRFDKEKRVESLIDTIQLVKRTIPSVKLLLIGSGQLTETLQRTIPVRNLQENVYIKRFDSNIVSYLRRAKILILPSLNEGMPNVVLEAAMCRVPSIINQFPGAHEVVIHNKTGFVSKTNMDTVDYISYLLSNDSKRRVMGQNAQEFVSSNFTDKTQTLFITSILS